jgi:hypothetical protein
MKNLLVILIVCFPIIFNAQGNCEGSFKEYFLNSNHIRASFFPRGNKFTSGDGRPGFLVPYPSIDRFSTIFGSSIWIAGFDDADNYKEAAETYQPGGKIDFSVGPLNTIGLPFDSICENYDRAWSVYYEDIQAHINDFLEDFKIDDTIPSIFGWPGRGNKFFKKYYGFELPNDNQGLAPFWDWNGNNIYDPENGDYPCITFSPGSEPVIPDQILWMVFNDVDPADSTGPSPLLFEIQLTAFAFHCQDNDVLNNTVFSYYKIINRAVLALDSAFFGVFNDYDLGCGSDDFIGCDSSRNTEFAYNADSIDGDIPITNQCSSDGVTYPGIPPVQSMTYLNQPMQSFIQYETQSGIPLAKYRLLNGMWGDGSSIRPEGDGHNINSTLAPTNYLFSGDPRDTASWAAINVLDYGYDQRTVSSVSLGRMDPGAVKEIKTAYIYSYDPTGGQLDQITRMYNNVDSLKTLFGSFDFDQHCSRFPICQDSDCVWPGDFDHNNIADHRDLLTWGFLKDISGHERNGLVSWRGQYSEDWNTTVSGINAKHSDGDGNGKIDLKDLTINEDHFRYTNRFYQKHDLFPEGPEIVLASNPMTSNGRISSIYVKAGIELQNVLGLAFEFDFDTSLYMIHQIRIRNCPADSNIVCFGTNDYAPDDPNLVVSPEYAFVATNHQPLPIHAGYVFDRLATGLQLKPNITLNDLPDTVIIRLKNLIALDPNGNDLHIGSNTLKIPNYLITGTKDAETTESSVFIYPNPADQSISIETEMESDVIILNLQGQVAQKINHSDIHQPIDISSLSPGIYFIQLQETGATYKFIKE